MFREAIEAAAVLRGEPYNSAVYVLIIVSKVDHKMGLVKLANQYGITDPIVFAQHGYRREKVDGMISIPTLPLLLQPAIYEHGLGVLDAIKTNSAAYTTRLFAKEYARFADQVSDRIAQ